MNNLGKVNKLHYNNLTIDYYASSVMHDNLAITYLALSTVNVYVMRKIFKSSIYNTLAI